MKKEFSDLEAISDEDELPFEKRDLWQKKWYMDITRLSKRGDIQLKLFMPPWDVDQVQNGYVQQFEFTLTAQNLQRMRKLTHKEEIVVSTDGAAIGNPGPSGSAAAFFARRKPEF